jgi:hypothetical protein
MIIKVDEQGKQAVNQLLDIALKHGGMNNLQGVVEILKSLQVEKPEPLEETK